MQFLEKVFPYSIFRKHYKHPQKVKVLCFHTISDEVNWASPNMPVNTFREICRYVAKNYQVISLNELNLSCKKPKVLITFDDATKDFIENALPILSEYKLPVVQHVITKSLSDVFLDWTQELAGIINCIANSNGTRSLVYQKKPIAIEPSNAEQVYLKIYLELLSLEEEDRERAMLHLREQITADIPLPKYMNEDDLRECKKQGVEIGCHTYSHKQLHHTLSNAIFDEEIRKPKQFLETKFDGDIRSFAFPNGKHNEASLEACFQAGYQFVFGTEETIYHHKNTQIAIPRLPLFGASSFKNKLRIEMVPQTLRKLKA